MNGAAPPMGIAKEHTRPLSAVSQAATQTINSLIARPLSGSPNCAS